MATSPYFSTSNQYIKYDIHVDEVSQSIANNTTTVRVWVIAWRTNVGYTTSGTGTCYCTINGTSYSQSISSSQKITYNSDTLLFDKTVTIPHNSDGTKTIYVSSYISHSRFSSSSHGFNVTLTKIPRSGQIITAPNFSDIDSPVIVYSNAAGSSVTSLQACISLDNSTDTISYRDIGISDTSYTFSLTDAERNTLRNATPNSNTLTVYFIIKTVLNGTTYYSSVQRTMTIVNANPTIDSVTYKDSNSATKAITNDDQIIIQKKSTVAITLTNMAALKGATLKKCEIEINAVKQSQSLSDPTETIIKIWGTINSTEILTAKVTITDSRDNQTVTTFQITMLEWYAPTALITCKRKSNFYDSTDLTVNADYSSLNGENIVTLSYIYREHNSGSWSAPVTITDGVTTTLTLANTKEWDVKVSVSDRLQPIPKNYLLFVGIGIPSLFIDNKRRSVGVNAIPDQDNMFVADRRISLKNPSNETVADLWTTTSGSFRSASFYIYDQNGTKFLNLNGRADGGNLALNDPNEKARAWLYVTPSGGQLYIYNDSNNQVGQFGVGSGNKDGIFYLKDHTGSDTIWGTGENGDFWCTTLHQTSSRKVKKNIVEMALTEARKILKLVAVKFDFKDEAKGKDKSGFIAEDVAEVLPNLVSENKDGIDYIGMIAYLQAVIKDHEERIEALEKQINGGT